MELTRPNQKEIERGRRSIRGYEQGCIFETKQDVQSDSRERDHQKSKGQPCQGIRCRAPHHVQPTRSPSWMPERRKTEMEKKESKKTTEEVHEEFPNYTENATIQLFTEVTTFSPHKLTLHNLSSKMHRFCANHSSQQVAVK